MGCYTSSGTTAIASCSGRKKRSIVDGILGKDDETIAATSQLEPLEPSIAEPEAKSQREGTFLLYWLTTTTTSPSPTFAAAQTIALSCTAADNPFSLCGSG